MWTKDNPRVPLGVIAMILKGCFWKISNVIIKFLFRSLLYLNPSTVDVVLNWYWAHTLIKFRGKIELVHEIDLVSDHLKYTIRLLVTNQESPELSLYTFKRVCRTTFQKAWGKLSNLLGMKLTTDITWLFLSAVNTEIFVYLFCYGCGV